MRTILRITLLMVLSRGLLAAKDAPLIASLSGVIFLGNAHDLKTHSLSVSGISFNGVQPPDEASLKVQLAAYLGKPLTQKDLEKLIQVVTLDYQIHQLPLVDVVVPEQDASKGTLQLVIVQAHVAQVTASGNKWTSSKDILAQVSLKPGDTISTGKIQDDLDWINANTFHNTVAVYSSDNDQGLTNVDFHTQDRFPLRVYAGYDNSGTPGTGNDRYYVGGTWGNAFGQNQQLTYQFTTSGDLKSLVAHSGSYIVPLPWHHTLTFFGAYTDTVGSVPPLIGVDGRTYQISGRYTVPLPTFRNAELGITYSHAFSAGFDYKYDKNSLLFGGLNTPLTLYDVDQFVMVYDGRFKDPYGEFIINDQLTVSPGNMGGNNNDAAFSAAHPGGNSDYVYNTLKLQRLTRLPWNFTLALRGTFQSSNDNLPVSEQLAFGGWDTIRGYDSREINADDGYYFTTELRSPTFSLGKLFRSERFQDQLQLLTFWDAGSAYSHALQPGEPTEIGLSSVGFGLRYSINDYLSMRFDFGAQLVNTSLDNDHGSASNLGIVLSY